MRIMYRLGGKYTLTCAQCWIGLLGWRSNHYRLFLSTPSHLCSSIITVCLMTGAMVSVSHAFVSMPRCPLQGSTTTPRRAGSITMMAAGGRVSIHPFYIRINIYIISCAFYYLYADGNQARQHGSAGHTDET